MSALYWLAIPVGATLVAMLLVAWVGRSGRSGRRPREDYGQLEQFHQFRRAMESGTAESQRRGSRPEGGGPRNSRG